MRRLSQYEMDRALSSILPKPLIVEEGIQEKYRLENIMEFANSDLGRGMLNHNKYCLVETIHTADLVIEEANVIPSNIDNFLLTISMSAYRKSKAEIHSGDILFSIPPFAFAYPLLISYHLILNHLSSNLIQDDSLKFKEGTGILIVTDNKELLSHIWRTTINNNYLRDFLQVFTLESGKFKPFTFNSKKATSGKERNFDGSLPWMTIYRAYRKQLPEEIGLSPEVIILDLIPFRHRKRAKDLIKWAKSHSKHVIVIAPSHDAVIEDIGDSIFLHVPINSKSIKEIKSLFKIEDEYNSSPITASWSMQSALPYLLGNRNIVIARAKSKNSDVIKSINLVYDLLCKSKSSKGIIPNSFIRMNSLLLKMLNICIPLEWYERARMSNEEPTLLELIKRSSRIPPVDREEQIAYETLMPHINSNILKIYEHLKYTSINIRSQLILKTIEDEIRNIDCISIIVSDQVDRDEFLVWLRSLQKFNSPDIAKINVITQLEWAKNQWEEVYLTDTKDPEVIIITCPWSKKYLSACYSKSRTKIIFIDAYNESKLINYQLNYLNQPEGLPRLWTTLNELFNSDFPSNTYNDILRTNINFTEYNVGENFSNVSSEKSSQDTINNLFSDQSLMDLLSSDWVLEETKVNLPKDSNFNDDKYINEMTQERVECIKVTTIDGKTKKVIYVPIDLNLKVKKFNKQEIESVSPFELKNKDIWVKVKEKKKRELFNEILTLASNTLLLKWIDINMSEWKLMLKELWQKYYTPNTYKKNIFEKIKDDINNNGGNVESYLTISNWISGDVGLVRSYENLEALAKLLKDERFKNRAKIIYQAMRELWGIHIKLGKSLGRLIEEQASLFNNSFPMEHSQWINLGKDIVIRVDDVLNTIELISIFSVETNNIYYVHPLLTEKTLSGSEHESFIERELISSE